MPGSYPNPSRIAVYDRDPRLDFFDRIAGGDQAALDDWSPVAMSAISISSQLLNYRGHQGPVGGCIRT
jgi:hypothetical protein